jgi:hypothetical protein
MAWPVVEDGLRFDVHRAALAGRRYGGGWLRWAWSRDGEAFANISAAVTFESPSSGTLALRYRCNGKPFDQRFRLIGEPCRFGGYRWRAVCPVTGARAAKLYSLGGAGFHVRRRYGRVAYRSQRAATPMDRVLMRRDRILTGKLKSDDPDFVPKPKWMRWKTYDRLTAQLWQAEELLDAHTAVLVARLGGLSIPDDFGSRAA